MLAFDVEAPGHVQHADVVEDQQAKGADPDPVQIDAAVRIRGRQPLRLCYDLLAHDQVLRLAMDLKRDVKDARSSPAVEPVWDQGAVRGDEPGASGTTGDGRGISGGDWLMYGVVAAVALAIGTVNAFSMAYDIARRGGVYDLRMPLVWEMSSVTVVVLATPIIFMTVRRMRAATTWPMRLALGLAGIVAFSALHVVGMVLLRKLLLALAGGTYDFGFSAETVLYEFRKDIVTCFMIGGPFWLLESRREDAQARLMASAPQSLRRPRPAGRTWSGCATARPASASSRATSSGSLQPATMSNTPWPAARFT